MASSVQKSSPTEHANIQLEIKAVAEHCHHCIYLELSSKNTFLIILITGL